MASQKKQIRIGFTLLGLILFVGVIFLLRKQPLPQPSEATPSPKAKAKSAVYLPTRASLPGQPAVLPPPATLSNAADERSPLADSLNLPNQTATADLAVVRNLLEEYRRAYGAYPVGENNAEILNALSGNNPRHLAFISRNHPAVSPAGSLLDRWGTAYFFHFQSSQEVEIRSAGPDHNFYTPDDLIREIH